MDISESFTVAASPDEVARILLSQELADARMKSMRITDYTHRREGDNAVTDFHVSADRLPSAAQRFVKNGIHITMTAQHQGNRIDYSFDMHGLPATVSMVETLHADGTGTRVDAEGEVKVKVPIVGAKLESQAARYVRPVFAKDGKLIKELLKN